MVPFTFIPFVKDTASSAKSKDLSDDDTTDLPNSDNDLQSSKFYEAVINNPSTYQTLTIVQKSPKCKQRLNPISDKSFSNLYNSVCNDDLSSVKDWFNSFVPHFKGGDQQDIPDHIKPGLFDTYGCSLAMTAVTHKSYQTLKFLLEFLPIMLIEKDMMGYSLNDVAQRQHNPLIDSIIHNAERFCKSVTLPQELEGSIFCQTCNVMHKDPNHDSSITHVFSEKREVLEINPHLHPSNVGYQMMTKSGWTENKGLGPTETGRKFLVKTQMKMDRSGIGVSEKKMPKVTHFEANDVSSIDDNKIHKRKIRLKTESRKKRKEDHKKARQWEINLRRSMNEYE